MGGWIFLGWYALVGVGVYSELRTETKVGRPRALLMAVTWAVGWGMSIVQGSKP